MKLKADVLLRLKRERTEIHTMRAKHKAKNFYLSLLGKGAGYSFPLLHANVGQNVV